MSFIELDLENVKEPCSVPAGRYETVITAAEVGVSGVNSKVPGSPQIKVTIGLPDEVDAQLINHWISFPNATDDAKAAKFKLLALKRFLEAYKVPYDSNGIDLERIAMDMQGRTANLELKVEEYNGIMSNKIVLPRFDR